MQNLIETFKKRNINCYFVQNKKEALKKALDLIPENASIGFGGSTTLEQVGILDILREKENINLLDRTKAKDADGAGVIYRQIFSSDVFLSSANAITQQGQIVNVDGRGNRTAAIIFGPKKVIIIAGKNKIVSDLDAAFERIKKIALPMNFKKLQKSPKNQWTKENMWGQVSIIERQADKDRMHVIIVGEDLGY